MGRKKRRPYVDLDKAILDPNQVDDGEDHSNYHDDSFPMEIERESIDLQHQQQHSSQTIEETTISSSKVRSAGLKKRRKKQKKKQKEKKKAQIQILITRRQTTQHQHQHQHPHYDNDCNNDNLNATHANFNLREGHFQEDNEIKTENDIDSDDSSLCTLPTCNTTTSFQHPNPSVESKSDVPLEQYISSSSDCFNRVLWNHDSVLRYSWFNNVFWIGKQMAAQPLLTSGRKPEPTSSNSSSDSSNSSNSDKEKITPNDAKEENQAPNANSSNGNFINERNQTDMERMKELELDRTGTINIESSYDSTSRKRSASSFKTIPIHNRSSPTSIQEEEEDMSIREKIKALSIQLHQIKTRLWPAAIECAKAMCTQQTQISSPPSQNFGKKITPKFTFEKARRACNPFEELGEGRKGGLNNIFLNRSAMKLVNIDALMDFSILPTLQHNSHNQQRQRPIPFRFVDLCGAPGGFTEYILRQCTQKQISVQGWGLSLMGENENGPGLEWKLQHLLQMKEAHFRVSAGADGTGDILSWDNVEALRQEILRDCCHEHNHDHSHQENEYYQDVRKEQNPFTDHNTSYFYSPTQLIDLVVADGGCQAQRDSSRQEELTLPMVVSEIAAALSLLKPKGKLIVKMFGFQSPPIQTVMEYLYNHFEKITVLKPVLSRPASAERYLVCFGYIGLDEHWDGSLWRDEILNCQKQYLTECFEEAKVLNNDSMNTNRFNLQHYLSLWDRDMLELNIKSCFGILACLKRECQKARGIKTLGNLSPPKRSLDMDMYRKEWRL